MARQTREQRAARKALLAAKEQERQQAADTANDLELRQLRAEVESLNGQVGTLTADNALLTSQIATLSNQVTDLTAERDSLADQVTDLTDELATADADIAIYASAVTQLDLCYDTVVLYNNNVATPTDYANIRNNFGVPVVTALFGAFPSYPDLGLSGRT